MPFWWSAQECWPPAVTAVAILAGVLFLEKVGEISVVVLVELWFVLGGSWVFCRSLKVVSAFSVFGLSELLAQLATSKADRVSRL